MSIWGFRWSLTLSRAWSAKRGRSLAVKWGTQRWSLSYIYCKNLGVHSTVDFYRLTASPWAVDEGKLLKVIHLRQQLGGGWVTQWVVTSEFSMALVIIYAVCATCCCGVGWVKIKLKICTSTVAHHSFKSYVDMFCSKLAKKCLKTFSSNKSCETATWTVKRTNRAERAWLDSKLAMHAGHFLALHRRLWVVDRVLRETVRGFAGACVTHSVSGGQTLERGDGTLYSSTSEVEAGRLSRIGLRW